MEKIALNTIAPIFIIKDVYGKPLDLRIYRGKKLLIAFFRHAGCPFCNLRVHALTKLYPELKEKNLEMIFFFESKAHVILKSSFHREISQIPIVSDPEKKWYDAYGLESSGAKAALGHAASFVSTAIQAKLKGLPLHPMSDGESIKTMPAEFLVDEQLVIREMHYSQHLSDRLNLETIRAFAARPAVARARVA